MGVVLRTVDVAVESEGSVWNGYMNVITIMIQSFLEFNHKHKVCLWSVCYLLYWLVLHLWWAINKVNFNMGTMKT